MEINMNQTDTIAAIATGMTQSGIGIIRISGTDAITIADRIFQAHNPKKTLETVPSHTVHYGTIIENGVTIDEVLVVVMREPSTYTRENTVEINCHGGILVMQKVLAAVLRAGARMAEPGEFTKRAFLNGRMDLSQAEAVIDVIHAQNEFALESSMTQLKGHLSDRIHELRGILLDEIAFIEAALDDPEHISLEGYPEQLKLSIQGVMAKLKESLDTYEDCRIRKEGIKTVILGKPNAGKSSLLNVLTKEERAIVTDIAGTTRDILEEEVRLKGLQLQILDTAGIRETDDVVEKIGVSRALEQAETADLIIYVVDGSCPLDENDFEIFKLIKRKPSIILKNKADLDSVVSVEELLKEIPADTKILEISAKEGTGIQLLEEAIYDMFGNKQVKWNEENGITNIRHKRAMEEAYESLKQVQISIENDMPEDFFSIDLSRAYEVLGTIVGERVEEDVVEQIFKKFCMGK
jgi:tRNA modification GTPase